MNNITFENTFLLSADLIKQSPSSARDSGTNNCRDDEIYLDKYNLSVDVNKVLDTEDNQH